MAGTTTSTLAGRIDLMLADADLIFQNRVKLLSAVNVQDTDSKVVRFNTQTVPSVVSAATEANLDTSGITSTAITIGADDATLAQYQINAHESYLLADTGKDSDKMISYNLGTALARTVDTLICTQFASFTTNIGSTGAAMTLDLLLDGGAILEATGYDGQMVAVLHPWQWNQIRKDAIDVATAMADRVLSSGYVATVAGIDVYTSYTVPNDGTDYSGAIYYKMAGVGLGHSNPLITLKIQDDVRHGGYLYGAYANLAAVNINAGAGFDIVSAIQA